MSLHLRVEIRHRNADGLRLSRVLIEYWRADESSRRLPWVRISHTGGVAPYPAAIAAALLELRADGKPILKRASEPDQYGFIGFPMPAELAGRRIGFTWRRGTSGASWGHTWFVGPDGYREGPWIAAYHESMYGSCNEEIEGHPWVLMDAYLATCLNTAVARGDSIHVRKELRPVPYLDEPGFSVNQDFLDGRPGLDLSGIPTPAAASVEPPPPPACDGE